MGWSRTEFLLNLYADPILSLFGFRNFASVIIFAKYSTKQAMTIWQSWHFFSERNIYLLHLGQRVNSTL